MMMAEENPKLRPEARAFDYDHLTDSQKSALDEILAKLDYAQKNISVKHDENAKKSGPDHGIYVPKKNHNKCLMLAGMRGSGKTSLLYSLIKLLNSEECGDVKFKDKSNEKVDEKYKRLRDNVLWLSPLEMETLPPATNLLAAILTRVDEAIDRFRGWHPKVHQAAFNLCQEERDILLEFNRLQQDVALAWNGNLEKRSATIDTDVYAIEVLRAEQSRVNVIERIQRCVEDLYTHFIKNYSSNSNHLFVLPVDDFDLNPQRCLDLVRVIRMYNVPRLVTLILCDQRIIHQLLNLKYFESIVRLESNPAASLGGMSFEEYGPSFELSSSAIKKLFPWSHKVLLDKMSAEEVFDFHHR